MVFISLKDLARSPMTVELITVNEKLCVLLTDEYGVYEYLMVENNGNQGVNL